MTSSFLKNILTLFILINSDCSFSQGGGFKKRYYPANSLTSVSHDLLETPGGNIIMVGVSYEPTNAVNSNKLTLMCTNAQGNYLWTKKYGNPMFEYLDNALQTRDGIVPDASAFFQARPVRDTTGTDFSVLIKFNYSGDTLWQKRFYSGVSGSHLYFQNATKTVDGGLLMSGEVNESILSQTSIILLKTDINGNELWRKKLVTPNSANRFWSSNRAVQDSATKQILLVGYHYVGASNLHGLLLVTDSLGNKIFQTSLTGTNGGILTDLIQTKDKNFVAVGLKYSGTYLGSWSRDWGYAVKFTASGTIIWTKELDPASIVNVNGCVQEMQNSDLLMTGYRDTSYIHNLGIVSQIRVLKAGANGNIIWKKYYGSTTNSDECQRNSSLRIASNGDILLTTDFLNSTMTGQQPYSLIRLDSTGCDSTEAYCKSIATSIGSSTKLTGWAFSVFPNPATNAVHITIDAPEDRTIILKVTDLAGREVEQIFIEHGKDLELNTTGYTSGVYLLSLMYEGKSLETKRLVIFK